MDIEKEMLESMHKMGVAHQKEVQDGIDKIGHNLAHGLLPAQALGVTSEHLDKLYAQAYQLYNMGKYEDAQKLFYTLIMANAMESKYVFGMAACCQMMEDWELAASNYALCGSMDATNPIPFYHASHCYMKDNDINSAIISLQMVIKRSGDRPEFATMKNRAEVTLESIKIKEKQGSQVKNNPELNK